MLYRMWSEGEDMGVAGERSARLWLSAAHAKGETAYLVPVSPDAPVFLLSPCCRAHVRSDTDGIRQWYTCVSCGERCEVHEDVPA